MSTPREVELCSRVPPAAAGQSLLDYMAARFRYRSRKEWRGSIEAGTVRIEGAVAQPEDLLRRGQSVGYRHERQEPEIVGSIRVLEETDGWVVIDKPAGLPCHADGVFVQQTVVHLLGEMVGHPRIRLVHRLDRETSGVMVVAKTKAASRELHAQFEARTVTKVYEAMVRGVVDEDRFSVDLPIGRDPDSEISIRRKAYEADAPDDARSASTAFEVLERSAETTRLRVLPQTGRAHQIRVHLEAVGHPIVGDKLYGRSDGEFLDWVAVVKADPAVGQAREDAFRPHRLHARELGFLSPGEQAPREFTAPAPW